MLGVLLLSGFAAYMLMCPKSPINDSSSVYGGKSGTTVGGCVSCSDGCGMNDCGCGCHDLAQAAPLPGAGPLPRSPEGLSYTPDSYGGGTTLDGGLSYTPDSYGGGTTLDGGLSYTPDSYGGGSVLNNGPSLSYNSGSASSTPGMGDGSGYVQMFTAATQPTSPDYSYSTQTSAPSTSGQQSSSQEWTLAQQYNTPV